MVCFLPVFGFGQTHLNLNDWLKNSHCLASVKMTHHDYSFFNRPESHKTSTVGNPGDNQEFKFLEGIWQMNYETEIPEDRKDAVDIEFHFKLLSGISPQTSVSIDFTFDNWSKANYVLLPAAAYNGNRFESRRIRYSPKLLDSRDIGPDKPIIISDVPRLNIKDGPSRIQERSGSMSVPAIGFQSDTTQSGFLLLTHQATKFGDTGIGIEESRDRKTAVISLTVPVVRENYQYYIADNQAASKDRAIDFKAGDEFTLKFRLYSFQSPNIQGLFNRFAEVRKDIVGETKLRPIIPFSSCFEVQQEKFNTQNWENESVKFTNPTKADANVKLFVETSNQAAKPLGENALLNCQIISLKPGESRQMNFKKSN